MNTSYKLVERKECMRCGTVFLQIGGVKIRSIRPEYADIDINTGFPKTGLCNSPRCARFSVAVQHGLESLVVLAATASTGLRWTGKEVVFLVGVLVGFISCFVIEHRK